MCVLPLPLLFIFYHGLFFDANSWINLLLFLFYFIPKGLLHIFLRTALLVINSLVLFLLSSGFVSPSIIIDNFVLCNYAIFISVVFHSLKCTISETPGF